MVSLLFSVLICLTSFPLLETLPSCAARLLWSLSFLQLLCAPLVWLRLTFAFIQPPSGQVVAPAFRFPVFSPASVPVLVCAVLICPSRCSTSVDSRLHRSLHHLSAGVLDSTSASGPLVFLIFHPHPRSWRTFVPSFSVTPLLVAAVPFAPRCFCYCSVSAFCRGLILALMLFYSSSTSPPLSKRHLLGTADFRSGGHSFFSALLGLPSGISLARIPLFLFLPSLPSSHSRR